MKIKVNEAEYDLIRYEDADEGIKLCLKEPIQDWSVFIGAQTVLTDDEGNPSGERLPLLGEVKRVEYVFAAPGERERALQGELDALKAQALEAESLIEQARSGLLPIPVPGEEWSAAKWYIQGDTVTFGGVLYECLKTCKGKAPTEEGYWREAEDMGETPPPLIWQDIESGAAIEVGTVVRHNDLIWRCIKAHGKSIIRQPSAVQREYWEEIT